MTTRYDKLVRDNMPDIIKKLGKMPITRTLNQEEYKHYLGLKLLEEVHEYLEDGSIEEFCDILEVLEALKKAKGFSCENVEIIKSSKAIKNGKFEKKLLLEKVINHGEKQ